MMSSPLTQTAVVCFTVLTTIAVGLDAAQSATYVVDLTSIDENDLPDSRSRADRAKEIADAKQLDIPVEVVAHGPTRAALPLDVSLVSLDASSYAVGDAFTFELYIKNTGSEPFAFPISMAQHRFKRGMTRARAARIGFGFSDSVLGADNFTAVMLFGSDEVQDSLLELLPGQSVSLRAKSRWVSLQLRRAPQNWTARDVAVRAWLETHYTQRAYNSASSANTLPVQLRER